jgi:hypothetical protein
MHVNSGFGREMSEIFFKPHRWCMGFSAAGMTSGTLGCQPLGADDVSPAAWVVVLIILTVCVLYSSNDSGSPSLQFFNINLYSGSSWPSLEFVFYNSLICLHTCVYTSFFAASVEVLRSDLFGLEWWRGSEVKSTPSTKKTTLTPGAPRSSSVDIYYL